MSECQYEWGDKVWLTHDDGERLPGIILGYDKRACFPLHVSVKYTNETISENSDWHLCSMVSPRDDDKTKTWRLPRKGDVVRVNDSERSAFRKEAAITAVSGTSYACFWLEGCIGSYTVNEVELVRLHDDPEPATDHIADASKMIEPAHDPVNHPRHYTSHPSGVECIAITEHENFCIGNAIKYLWRAGEKGHKIEDLEKAAWYVNREIQRLKALEARNVVG